MPMSRRCTGMWVTSSPPTMMRPSSGVSKPAIIRSVVVLPQPEGPSSAKNSPGCDRQVDAVDHARLAVEALLDAFEANIGGDTRGRTLTHRDGTCDSAQPRRMRVTRASMSSLRSLYHFQSTWMSCATFASVL